MAGLVQILSCCEEIESIYTLGEFVQKTLAVPNARPESCQFDQFLQETVVCLGRDYALLSASSAEVRHAHCTLVDSVIYNLLRKTPAGSGLRLEEPTQTLGYSTYAQTGALRKNPNLTLTLKSLNWEMLNEYAGTELMAHLLSGTNLYVLEPAGDAYVQVIGNNLAKLLKNKELVQGVKREPIVKFRDYKDFLKKYTAHLKDRNLKKPDVLAKLPLVNRMKMLYSPITRKNKWFPAKHPLNLPVAEAAGTIVSAILGPHSSLKYKEQLEIFFCSLAVKFKRVNLKLHLEQHCPLPKHFERGFAANTEKEFSFEWLFSQHCSWQQVCNFTVTLLLKVLPKQLLGFNKNRRAFQKNLVLFLRMGLWQKISTAALCVGYKFSAFTWIKESSDTPRRLLVGKILFWLYNEFIVPVLQHSFYITEKQQGGHQLFFYRKPVWAVAQHKALQKLEGDSFLHRITPLQAKVCQDFTQFPPAKLRIQPKTADFRPIMHFKSKIQVSANMRLSGNNLLAGVPQILRNAIQEDLGVLVLDYSAVLRKLSEFREQWVERGSPPLYFLSMDIAKAFDSVKTEYLQELLGALEMPLVSSYYKYIQLSPRMQRPPRGPFVKQLRMKFKKEATREGKYPMFRDLPFAANTLNIPTSRTLINSTEKLLMIERILLGNVIRFNRQCFKGQKGVPQGLSCSPLLSNIYFSKFEEQALAQVKADSPNSLFLATRLHDDYLLLSESPDLVQSFVGKIQETADRYQFSFSQEKISSNIQAHWAPNYEESITGWVGLTITPDLQIIPHISGTQHRAVSFDYISGKPVAGELKNKLVKLMNISINLLKNRSRARSDTVKMAVIQLMNLQALRFLVYLKTVRKFYRCSHSPQFLSRLIVGVTRVAGKNFPEELGFFRIAVQQFAKAFTSSALHSVAKRLENYLEKLTN